MQIKMKASAAGPDGVFQDGHVYMIPGQISQKQADEFIRGGFAVLVYIPRKEAVIETATAKPAETATLKRQKRK
jgi:hypothetical protein